MKCHILTMQGKFFIYKHLFILIIFDLINIILQKKFLFF